MIQRACRCLLVAIAFIALPVACDSSSTKKKPDAAADAGADAGGDAPADINADGNTDIAADTAADASADAAGDGPVLTAIQARGKYLVEAVIACSDCHTPPGADGRPDMTKFLAGNAAFIMLPTGDALPTRNLTNHETGLKNRTDEEVKAMILNGQRPVETGGVEYLNPFMPYYVFHNMKDEDADAIVAFLRTVPGVENSIPRRSQSFDVPAAAAPLDLTKVPAVDDAFPAKDSALRGKYLATQIGLCVECHTQHLAPGSATVLDEAHLFEGGEDFSPLFAATLMIMPVSKNLTSDEETGLGTWTSDDIVNVLHQGKAKDGSGICPPMPTEVYRNLTDADATDIANYIRSLPPKVHMVPDMCMFPPMPPPADGGTDGASSEGGSTGG